MLHSELATLEGFQNRVKVPRAATGVASLLAVLSAAAILYNVFSVLKSFDANPGAGFFDLYFSTVDENGNESILWVIIIWAPVILLPLSLIFLAYAYVTHNSAVEKAYRSYLERGWIAEQVPLGFNVVPANEKESRPVVLLTDPSTAPESFAQVVQSVQQQIAATDPKAQKQLGKKMSAGIATGVTAATFFPNVPPTMLATVSRNEGRPVVVVAGGAGGKHTIYDLKK